MLGPARGWDTPPLPTSLRARVGPRQRGLPTHWLWLREDLTGSMGAHPRGRGWTDVGPTKDRGLYGGWEATAGSGLVLGSPLPPAPPRRLLLWVDCAEALDGLCRGSPGPWACSPRRCHGGAHFSGGPEEREKEAEPLRSSFCNCPFRVDTWRRERR